MDHFPSHSWLHQKDQLEAFARSFDRDARLKRKRSWLWNIGALKHAAITFGNWIFIPDNYTVGSARNVIPHETLGHVRQYRWCGFGIHPWLGLFPGMFLAYIWGLIFPIFLAWGRYRCELHAESKSWEWHLINGVWTPEQVREKAVRFAGLVAGAAYGFAVPKPWAVWGFKRRAEKVIRKVASKK